MDSMDSTRQKASFPMISTCRWPAFWSLPQDVKGLWEQLDRDASGTIGIEVPPPQGCRRMLDPEGGTNENLETNSKSLKIFEKKFFRPQRKQANKNMTNKQKLSKTMSSRTTVTNKNITVQNK